MIEPFVHMNLKELNLLLEMRYRWIWVNVLSLPLRIKYPFYIFRHKQYRYSHGNCPGFGPSAGGPAKACAINIH
jgi:hypothetical protein